MCTESWSAPWAAKAQWARLGLTLPTFTFTFNCLPGKTHEHRSRGDTTWRARGGQNLPLKPVNDARYSRETTPPHPRHCTNQLRTTHFLLFDARIFRDVARPGAVCGRRRRPRRRGVRSFAGRREWQALDGTWARSPRRCRTSGPRFRAACGGIHLLVLGLAHTLHPCTQRRAHQQRTCVAIGVRTCDGPLLPQ